MSDTCDKIHKLKIQLEISCSMCDSIFIRSNKNKKYCSSECSQEARKIRSRENSKRRYHERKDLFKKCRWCNKETSTSSRHDNLYWTDSASCINKNDVWISHRKNKKLAIEKRRREERTIEQKKKDADVSRKYRQRNKEKNKRFLSKTDKSQVDRRL